MRIYLVLLFCVVSQIVVSQSRFTNENLVLFECIGKNKAQYNTCLYNTFGAFLVQNFKSEHIDKLYAISKEESKDTLRLGLSFVVGRNGTILKESFSTNLEDEKNMEQYISAKISDYFFFNLPINNCGKPVPYIRCYTNLYFVLDKKKSKSISLLSYAVVDYYRNKENNNNYQDQFETLPIHKKCGKYKKNGNKVLKSCLAKQISKFVSGNFNTKCIEGLGSSECTVNTLATFLITKEGSISDIKVYADHHLIKAEIIRVLRKFPKLQPGIQKGKPVNVLYDLPIKLQI